MFILNRKVQKEQTGNKNYFKPETESKRKQKLTRRRTAIFRFCQLYCEENCRIIHSYSTTDEVKNKKLSVENTHNFVRDMIAKGVKTDDLKPFWFI